jgi:selenocysteine lyase/cysteine desulfurase
LEAQKEDQEILKKKIETDLMYQMYENEKQKKRKDALHQQSEQNKKKILQRKQLEQQMTAADREFVARELAQFDIEDEQFEDYANRVIDYMEKNGRNTWPLKRVNFHFYNTKNNSEILKIYFMIQVTWRYSS